MRVRHPELTISITSARQEGLLRSLRRREVDLATLWDYAWDQLDAPDLELQQIASDPTTLLLPSDHPLAGREVVSMAELAEEAWVVRAEHPVAQVLSRLCAEAGFVPRVEMAADDYQELQGMVAAGLGIALAPRLAVLTPRTDVRVLPIAGNPAPRRILLARLASARLAPPVRAAIPVFVDCAAALSRAAQPVVTD
ncbi:LysR substrate-binding domain-containing protein [Luteococcus peritonei]